MDQYPTERDRIREWLSEHWKAATIIAVGVWWVLHTFAEKEMVKELHQEAISHTEGRYKQAIDHSDKNYNQNRELLIDIRSTVNRMEDRQWNSNPRGKNGK